MRIFLADLGHNKVTKSSDVYPLGVANLAMYTQAGLPQQDLEFHLFREPEDLKVALDTAVPDVVGFSSYSWNHQLAMHFAAYTKARHPQALTLMGGPNFPLTIGEQESYLRDLPSIDVAVRGPTYEGERAFLNLIQRYAQVGQTLDGLYEEGIPGNLWVNRRTGEFVHGGDVPRIHDLDEIPSPYLSGLMDPYFATGYFPMMQIARGCPFTCAFCNSSVRSNSKIYSHSLAAVKADLLYIAQRIRPEIPICFADDNFGMYDLDEEVADYIAYLQQTYHWPQYIRTTTGKNRHERIIRVMRKTGGILPMTAAVQSMNPVVLQNIGRSNIKLEAYAKIQEEVNSQGMQSYGELILCMPGETKESFKKAVSALLDAGVKRVSAHQLMLLHGAPLNNPDSRERWQFNTRFRVVARNIGNYTGVPIVETEEIVVETPTFSFADYLETRIFHLLLTIYFYEANFEEAFAFAAQHGVKAFALVEQLQALLPHSPADFQQLIADFVRESQEELFLTQAECNAWAQQNYQGLVDGTVGGNLLSKYSMIARFYTMHSALDFLQLAIGEALAPQMEAEKAEQLTAVITYLRAVMLHAPFAQSLQKTYTWPTSYDVDKWRRESFTRPLADYRYDAPCTFTTQVDPQVAARITTRIQTFGEHPAGLGKFTRTMFAQDLRRVFVSRAEMAH